MTVIFIAKQSVFVKQNSAVVPSPSLRILSGDTNVIYILLTGTTGLWRPVLSLTTDGFKRVNDPWTIQSYLIKKAERSLPREVGENYKNVVISCLSGRFDVENDNKEDLKLQQAFREQVLDVLDRAAESIG